MKKNILNLTVFISLIFITMTYGRSTQAANVATNPVMNSATTVTKLVLQYENFDIPPWNFTNGTGINFLLLKSVAKELPEVQFEFRSVPWKRCFNEMKDGAADGCFSASFSEERKEFGVYPMLNNTIDDSKRLYTMSYNLYVKKENAEKIKLDGFKIIGLPVNGIIAAPSGWSIEKDLKDNGYKLDQSTDDYDANFKKVQTERVFGYALLSSIGDEVLKNPQFTDVVAINKPLVSKNYYLMFSHQVFKKNPELINKIWNKIAEIRDSADFKKQIKVFLANQH